MNKTPTKTTNEDEGICIAILRVFQSAISHESSGVHVKKNSIVLFDWLFDSQANVALRFFMRKIITVKMVAASTYLSDLRRVSGIKSNAIRRPLPYSKLQSSRHANYASKVHQHLHISRWIPSRYKLTGQSLTTQPVILSLLHLHDATMASTQHRLISRSTNLIQIHSPLSSLF